MSTANLILLVEDNSDDEELTLRALKKAQVPNQVMVARDGAEAVDFLVTKDVQPQVVLLDLNLPKLDGLEVLRRIRANEPTKHLPVVILTSSKEDTDIARSYQLGANSYVRKPVDFKQFIDTLNTLSMYWLAMNHGPLSEAERLRLTSSVAPGER
jgi:two-component system, response regulator